MINSQQDRFKSWLHLVRKKTTRLSTRITARLGLISLTRDEEFERHYEAFKKIEKTIKNFIKNLNAFVDHFENFLLSLQNTSENLAEFYRDKSRFKELEELRRRNKSLACEHFQSFRRSVDRHVVTVANQLLQKFSGPQQLINKRSAKLLDYDNHLREMEACRDDVKKASIKDHYVIAKDIYDRINKQLIDELPLFNQFALLVFKECIMVLLESRRNLILSYTKQTASLLETPLMMTYTASEVTSNILMSCSTSSVPVGKINIGERKRPSSNRIDPNISFGIVSRSSGMLENGRRSDGTPTTGQSSSSGPEISRPQSAASQLSSDFERMANMATVTSREISSTPVSNMDELEQPPEITDVSNIEHQNVEDCVQGQLDEIDAGFHKQNGSDIEQLDVQSDDQALELDKEVDRIISRSMRADEIENRFHKLPRVEPITTKPKSAEPRRRKQRFPIFVASWPFVATGPNQLTIVTKQQLKLIKPCDECGNSDWSLVQDKRGQVGYVPSSYISKRRS